MKAKSRNATFIVRSTLRKSAVKVEPPYVALDDAVIPMRHGQKMGPHVLDRNFSRSKIDDGAVAEDTLVLV